MLYYIQNYKSKKKLELKVYNEMIEQVNHLSLLGILIDDKCNWNYHINYIRAKLRRSHSIINKIKHKLPLNNRIKIYYSIFESNLNYCSSIWGSNLFVYYSTNYNITKYGNTKIVFFNLDIEKIYKIFNLLIF